MTPTITHTPPYLSGMTPEDLGLPDKFKEFRPTQVEGVDFALGKGVGVQPRRFPSMAQPPGAGKSVTGMAIGSIAGCKFAILTATRSLEAQYMKDFSSCGLVNIQGRNNYHCKDQELDAGEGPGELNCEQGNEMGCKFSNTKLCTYREKVEIATDANAFVTNYQYWMSVRARNPNALEREDNPIRLLICDEAHLASSEAARHISAWLPHKYAHEHGGEIFRKLLMSAKGELSGPVDESWVQTLEFILGSMADEMGRLALDYGSEYAAFRGSKRYRGLKKVHDDISKITLYGRDGNWLWLQSQDSGRQTGVRFECIWPGRYMEKYVWTGVPRVVLMSATLRPKALAIMGLNDRQYRYKEWPRQFPAANNPVLWLPTGGLGKNASSEEMREAIHTADAIYDEWAPKTNILVQTASYKRAEWLAQNSRWGRHMLLNRNGAEAVEIAEKFQRSEPPCILVSPSYTAGWDLPPREGRWGLIHVLKLPFPDRSDPIVKARADSDLDYYSYETAQTLQQSTGRMNRKPSDKAMVIITDDAIDRFRKYARRHFNSWYTVGNAHDIPRYPDR